MTIEVIRHEESAPWINATGLETAVVQDQVTKVTRELANWVTATRGAGRPSLFNRRAYVAPDNPYTLMDTAKNAVDNDDVVGGVCDVTEGLMFQGTKWEAENPDDADIFNQMARDLNLDEFVRAWHREDFTFTQSVVGMWLGRRTYTVRGQTDTGKKKKRKVTIACPIALTFLDSRKVVPLKPGPFGQDRLAWHATDYEYSAAIASVDLAFVDPVLDAFTTGPVSVDKNEETYLQSIGVDPKRLLGLNPGQVFRICRTKASYERWPSPRLKSVFPLLDLKQQLMEADRVSLVGSANYLLLVRQGSKEEPAAQEELDNLNENFKVVAKLPVIVGDHRLQIDIITPNQDNTLKPEKYDTLDRRILSRTMGALTIASSGQRNETSVTVARGVARLLENRRHMLKRALEMQIARMVVDHPANAGVFDGEPNLTFTPRNVQLDADAEVVQAILALRNSNELSRESTLEYFGFDQAVEAQRREFEDESGLDDIFQTRVPFSAAGPGGAADGQGAAEAPQVSGARGGRPKGGGNSPKSPQGQVKPHSPKSNPST